MATINIFHGCTTDPDGALREYREYADVSGISVGVDGIALEDTPLEDTALEERVSIVGIESVEASPGRRACAVALVPPKLDRQFCVRGVEVAAGMALLSHGDSVSLGEQKLWISAEPTASVVPFDPAVHSDEFCFRTKKRLQEGEPIVLCPGTGGRSCGVHYTEAAWGNGLRCPDCGHDPSRTAWNPPKPRQTRSLEELLRLLDDAHA